MGLDSPEILNKGVAVYIEKRIESLQCGYGLIMKNKMTFFSFIQAFSDALCIMCVIYVIEQKKILAKKICIEHVVGESSWVEIIFNHENM